MQPTEQQVGTFAGIGDTVLSYRAWRPSRPPRAAILICHGVADHGGRYMNLVGPLTAAGYAVYAHDHRGHGASGGLRLHVERFGHYVEDLRTFHHLVASREPGLSLYLLAHSMGSAVALRYLLDHPTDVAGLITSGTALYAGEGFPSWLLRLNRAIARMAPRLRLVSVPTGGISRDQRWVDETQRDPLVYHGPGTARLAVEIQDALAEVRPRVGELSLPLLILQGGEDALTNGAGSRLLYERAASPDKTLKAYEGAYHEVFNDLPAARQAFVSDVLAWLDARCPAG